jgi:hypothetical protein
MGEPIKLYSPEGDMVTIYGKAQAAELLGAGYSEQPPALPETEPIEPKPAATVTRKRQRRGN